MAAQVLTTKIPCSGNGEVVLAFGHRVYLGLGLVVFCAIILAELFGSPFIRNIEVLYIAFTMHLVGLRSLVCTLEHTLIADFNSCSPCIEMNSFFNHMFLNCISQLWISQCSNLSWTDYYWVARGYDCCCQHQVHRLQRWYLCLVKVCSASI